MRSLVLLCLLAAPPVDRGSEHWPGFRGPGGNGVVTAGRFPTEWAADRNIAWQVDLPGSGWASPAVWGDRVFVSCVVTEKGTKPKGFTEGARDMRSLLPWGRQAPKEEYRWQLVCLDRKTGRRLWEKECARRKPAIPAHPSNTYATESPVTDGRHVCVLLGPIGVVCCYDRDGKELWRKDVGVGPMTAGFGTGSSPLLADGRLFLQRDNEKRSSVTALDVRTGAQLWQAQRDSKSSWSTPLLWRTGARAELIVAGSGKVVSYDPATGKEIWRMGGIPATFTASPTADGERLYFGTSSPTTTGTLYAVKAGATGDITLPKGEKSGKWVAWSLAGAGPGMPSPVVCGGYLYLAGSGFLTCLDARTGARVYRARLTQTRSVAASPWVSGGKLFVLDEDGQTLVVKTGPKFEVLARNRVKGLFWATPAAAGDALFLRAADRLYCIRK
jgi:outer membrane protein assembly factor BamB